MAEKLSFTVPSDCDGMTAKWFLKSRCGLSTRMITRLKREKDGILMNRKILRTIDPVTAEAAIVVSLPEEESSFIEPREGELDIVFEDSHLLVVNKPPYMPVHPAKQHQTDTLANIAVWYAAQKGESYVFRTHNRLDRNTSGLVLIAKDKYSVNLLKNKVRKTYLALVHGQPKEEGTVDAPIGLRDDSKIVRCVRPDGSPSVTHYKMLCRAEDHSLVSLWLETGRTHQIRCHMSFIGHPLLGDDLYGGSLELIPRQALHCASLRFTHPVTGEELDLKAPLPQDMRELTDRMKKA